MSETKTEKKWAGKYDSPEAMEQGLLNLIPAFAELKEESKRTQALMGQLQEQNSLLQEVVTKMPQPSAQPSPDYEDDPRKYIDAQMARMVKAMELVPKMVQAEIAAAVAPNIKAEEAKNDYIGANPDYDEPNIQRFLSSNPGVNRTFKRLVSNPDTAADAFAYAHDLYRAQISSAPKTTSVNSGNKQAATAPSVSPAPTDIPGEDLDREQRLKGKAIKAQGSYAVDDELAFAKEFFNGSKFIAEVEKMRPDWAPE